MTKKRGNNEGSIYRRKSGTWAAQYTVWTAEGRRRRTISGKTRAEVSRRLTEAMGDRDRGLVYHAGNLTVGEYLARWLEDSVRGTVRESTYERYGYAVRPHIEPALGRLKLRNLNATHVRGFYREKLDAGLAPATVHKLHGVLHKALDQAVADGLIPRNATRGVGLPRLSGETVNPLSAEEANRLLEAACGDRLEALYVLAVHGGLRLGELLALRWKDADLERGALKVRRTITHAGGGWRIGETKSGKGRKVRLTRTAAAALGEHRRRQLEERMRLAGLWEERDLVFPNGFGGILNPSNLRNRSFKRIKERAGVPTTTRFHDLRHTCATLLLGEGVNPKVVSEQLGHASIRITLDTYSHVLPDMQESAAAAMEAALS